MNANRLSLNFDKIHFLQLTPKNSPETDLDISYCNKLISKAYNTCIYECIYVFLLLSMLHYSGVILLAVSIHLVVQFDYRRWRAQQQALLPIYNLSKISPVQLQVIISIYIYTHIFMLLKLVKIYRICKG
jgi:hypothetical protein